ncbi:DNRLRE domain-containing protein [Paenibacillus massiliensis]|uniref:DNRLRE domain-containing protein n=1 Tax=Paenibacillus massiliensis TaxID=225917 RepID=UPI00037D1636|nr:DNRLRE domain-containing protein [Paenibacillus massiliensis]
MTMKGLVLSLHASLADKGLSCGTNNARTSQWYDLSGKGNHGVLDGFSFQPESGWVGNNTQADPYALYFDGYSTYVDCGGASSLKPSASVTFEAWFLYVGGNVLLSTGGQLANNQGFAAVFNEFGQLELHIKTETKSALVNLGTLPRLQWYHIAGSYDDTTGYLNAYLNGAPMGRTKAVDSENVFPSRNLIIGRHHIDPSGWFRGAIPAIRVYNRALSMDEVGENYLNGYLITDDKNQTAARITVPERSSIPSWLNVAIGGKVTGHYNITTTRESELASYIEVRRHSSFEGSITINPNTYVRSNYRIIVVGGDSLSGAINVTQVNDVNSSVTVNPHTRLTGKYGIERLFLADLPSSLKVNQSGILPASIGIHPYTKAVAKYGVEGLLVNYLESSITVKGLGNLVGNIKVNSVGIAIGRYKVQTIVVKDLESGVDIKAVRQLICNIKVNTNTYVRGKYGVLTGGIKDLSSSLTIASTSNVPSRISVATETMVRARYGVTAGGEYNLHSSLTITSTFDVESKIGVAPYAMAAAKYNITGLYTGELESGLTVRETADLKSIIRITPYTWMRAKYNVIEPPTYTTILYPNKDAFVRESLPRMNFGIEEQMVAGYTLRGRERFRGYVGFDLLSASIPNENATIAKAVLKVYLDGQYDTTKQVQVIEPTANWTEYGVTWQNQPFPFGYDQPTSAYDGIIVTENVRADSGYMEFDVTETIAKWHTRAKQNYGFILKALAEGEDQLYSFLTKEQKAFRPMLEITYYDTRILSFGRASIESEITVQQNRNSDLISSLFIRSFQGKVDFKGSIFVDNPRDLFSYITANRYAMVSKIVVSRKKDNSIEGSISVSRRGKPFDLDSSIVANKPEVPFSICVNYRNDLQSFIVVRRNGFPIPEISGTMTVNRPDTVGTIGIKVDEKFDLESLFVVSTPFIPGHLEIIEKVNLSGNIKVRTIDSSNLPAVGYVKYHDSLEGSMTIHKSWMEGYMDIFYAKHLGSSISVRGWEGAFLESSLVVPPSTDMESNLYVPPKKDIPSHIQILSGYLASSITIPNNKIYDKVSLIAIRNKGTSDLESSYGVRSGWLGSSIGVRVERWKDLTFSIEVRSAGKDELKGDVTVHGWGENDLPSNIRNRKTIEDDLLVMIKARVADYSWLDGSISIRMWGEYNKPSSIGVRGWDRHDQRSHLAVRWNDYSEINGSIIVNQVSDLPSTLSVRVRIDNDGLEGSLDVWYKSVLDGSISVWEKSLLESLISVWRKSTVDSSISVRRADINEIPSSINVWEKSVLVCQIALRHKSQIPCSTDVKQHSSIECGIDVVAEYGYCFIM